MTGPSPDRPAELHLLRHGESTGNVARAAAESGGLDEIDIAERDADVPLSDLGREQAASVGAWYATQPPQDRPDVVVASPYVRALETARAVAGRLDVDLVVDERLRERELGVFDRLTHRGITSQYPEEAERRQRLGKFYHRPPGGESWADVALRLRSFWDTAGREHAGRRVLVVTHEVVVFLARYVLEGLTEQEVLRLNREVELANCGLTRFALPPGEPARLVAFDDREPVGTRTDVTEESDAPAAPR